MTNDTKDTLLLWLVLGAVCWLAVMVGVFVFGAAVKGVR